MTAVFILGLGSRYSYLAATQVPALEEEFGVAFDWWPIWSPDLIVAAHGGASSFAAPRLHGQYEPAYRDRDARRWADFYGVPYRPQEGALELREIAEACWAYADPALRRKLALDLVTAILAEGWAPDLRDIADLAPPDRDGAVAHDEAVERALEMGAFGVPTFILGREAFWGNDRLPLFRAALARGVRSGG